MTDDAGVYIHIPFCRSRCAYCGFYSIGQRPTDRFIDALHREMESYAEQFHNTRFDTVYLGGGTPSVLSPKQLTRIMSGLRQYFNISRDAEITMEMNPSDMSEEYLMAAKAEGINRISIGVQTPDNRLLKKLGRDHTGAEAKERIRLAHKLGFKNISIDLMYELPGQSALDFHKSLLWAVHLPVNHVSVYSLILEEGTRFYQMNERHILARPTEEESWSMYQDMIRVLAHYGFERYEISSFARKGYRSRHNRKYWKLGTYLGLGPAACSRIGHRRLENHPGVRSYENTLLSNGKPPVQAIDLSQEEEIEEYCFLHLRMREGIHICEFEHRYKSTLAHWYGDKIHALIRRGLLCRHGGYLSLTYKGAALGNYVFGEFLMEH